jgi:hypothetical protein
LTSPACRVAQIDDPAGAARSVPTRRVRLLVWAKSSSRAVARALEANGHRAGAPTGHQPPALIRRCRACSPSHVGAPAARACRGAGSPRGCRPSVMEGRRNGQGRQLRRDRLSPLSRPPAILPLAHANSRGDHVRDRALCTRRSGVIGLRDHAAHAHALGGQRDRGVFPRCNDDSRSGPAAARLDRGDGTRAGAPGRRHPASSLAFAWGGHFKPRSLASPLHPPGH